MILVKYEDETGRLAGAITAEEKTFKTGSKGYFGTGKVTLNGKKYQVQTQLVEIGSKPSNGNGETVVEVPITE